MLPIKGLANIALKGKRPVSRKAKIISATAIILAVIICAGLIGDLVKESRKEDAKKLQTDLYSSLGLEDNKDLSELIQIKGSEQEGYYLSFVDDIDEKLEKILEDNKETYDALDVKDVSTLKQFLKAQMVTEYPNLGSSIGGSNVTSLDGCLFIGDSITEGLELYGDINNNNVQFRGVASSTPSNWLNNQSVNGKATFSNLPENSSSIQSISLMLGINNPWQIDEMKQLIQKIHEKYPEKIIFVQKIWHLNGGDANTNNQIDEYNRQIEDYCNQNDYTRFVDATSNVPLSDSAHPTTEGYKKLAQNIADKISIENIEEEESEEEEEDENKFQGAIRIRRVTPNKSVGEYRDTTGVTIEKQNEGNTGEGLGEKEDLPENIRQQIIDAYNIPEASQNVLDSLSYLTVPYIDYNGAVKDGHMIVNKDLADEVLAIFQELYNIMYPIENMDIVEEYEVGLNESTEYAAVDDNDTYSFYYASNTAQLTGNAIVINPQINPKVQNGTAEHQNARLYVDRENTDNWSSEAKDAYIDNESRVYEIFKKYGWTWGGENEDNPNYGYFEKTTTKETASEEASINSKVYDLKYVPEDVFNQYIENNDITALNVFTLDEDKKLTTATWSYSTEEGIKISKGKTINYKNALSKYNMPMEYLLAMLVHTEDKVFCEGLADLAIDSEYIVMIEDKVTTVQTTVTTDTVVTQNSEESGYLSTISSNQNIEVSVSESATQTAEVTYVDCWYLRFSKDYSYSTEYLLGAGASGQTLNLSGQAGEYIGDFKITAYCSCGICCGQYSPENGGAGTTASGTIPQAGLTVASDPSVLPLDSYIMFNNHVYHVEDTGGGVNNNHIDLYMNSHQEALNWGVKTLPVYWAEDVGEGQSSSSSSGNTNNNPVSVNIDAMGNVNKSETSNRQGPTTTNSAVENGRYTSTTTTVTTTTGTISYTYNTGDIEDAQKSGNSQKFVDLYKKKECKNVKTVEVPWLVESLAENSKTANMVEITQYLFAQATGKNYENSSLVFEEYIPGDFENASGTAGLDTFLEYLHAWEGNTGVSADGTQYLIGTDGYGNATVGYGVDIFNGGFADRFAAAGYSTNIGDYVPVEFVDNLEKEEVQNNIDTIKAQTAGLNLTQYQIYALVSRAYNCGISGALGVRNGKTFVQAYTEYWNQETDDQYKEPPSDDMYNHRLYTQYMNKPDTAKTANGSVYSEGLANRRKSEWILFKTGYYDRIDKYCSNSEGNGEFLEVAKEVWTEVCTSGRFTTYGGSSIPCNGPTIDCSAFVSWVLYEYGYTEFEGGQTNTWGLMDTDWTAKYGWEQIPVGSGENPIDILQPGDIFVRNGGGTHHVTLVVEVTDDGRILCYDCGNTSANWNGTDGSPMDKSYFLTESGEGKIIRVTEP